MRVRLSHAFPIHPALGSIWVMLYLLIHILSSCKSHVCVFCVCGLHVIAVSLSANFIIYIMNESRSIREATEVA